MRDATALGGGIRRAGSNPRNARALLDGNPATGWGPNPDDDPDDWFVEIDLGRSVSAHSVALIFAADAPPFELFDLLLSSGEPQLDHVANPVEGSLIYRIKERFKENARHRVAYAPGAALYLTPIRYLQIRNLKHVPDARRLLALGLLRQRLGRGDPGVRRGLSPCGPSPLSAHRLGPWQKPQLD